MKMLRYDLFRFESLDFSLQLLDIPVDNDLILILAETCVCLIKTDPLQECSLLKAGMHYHAARFWLGASGLRDRACERSHGGQSDAAG